MTLTSLNHRQRLTLLLVRSALMLCAFILVPELIVVALEHRRYDQAFLLTCGSPLFTSEDLPTSFQIRGTAIIVVDSVGKACLHARMLCFTKHSRNLWKHRPVLLIAPARRTLVRVGERRTSVTSPSLCHDVLQRLGRSLEQHHGCDLIKFKPTGDLWENELNNAIKPRKDLVVGPRPGKGNKQRRATDPIPFTKLLDPEEGLLSKESLDFNHKKYSEQNNGLLIAANLSGAAVSLSKYNGSLTSYFLNELYSSLFGMEEHLFRYGLVRVLAWIPDELVCHIIPRSVHQRNRFSVKLEAAFSITEIAGSSQYGFYDRYRRWNDLEIENMKALHGSMEDIPAERLGEAPTPMIGSLEPNPKVFKDMKYTTEAAFYQRWIDVDEKIEAIDPSWELKRLKRGWPGPGRLIPRTSPAWELKEQWRDYLQRAVTTYNRHWKIKSAIDRQRELDAECRAFMSKSEGGILEVSDDLKRALEDHKKHIESMSRDSKLQVRKAVDDYRAYDVISPALQWNARTFEPLMVHPDEFQPEKPMAMLDIIPKPSFRQILDTDDKVTCFDYILRCLMSSPGQSVYAALKEMLQGDPDEFIETVPALKDPTKGGCFDLTDLRVRSLPASLFMEIALAYERWPFRIDTMTMLFGLSGEGAFH